MSEQSTVGRRPRKRTTSDDTRAAIADALLDLITCGNLQPSRDEIARRAGVARRTVFLHFNNTESMYAALVKRQEPRVASLIVPISREMPITQRIIALAEQRDHLYSTIANLRRAVRYAPDAHSSPTLAKSYELLRRMLDHQVRETFAPELRNLPHPLAALQRIELATSFESWHNMVTHQRLPRTAVVSHIVVILRRELGVSASAVGATR